MQDAVPDEALVVRGGRNLPEDIARGIATHPAGVTGVSAEAREGLGVVDLARTIPHGSVGVTTAGAIRAAGGDVVRTAGRSRNHVTVTGLTPAALSALLTPTTPNPAKQD